MREIIPDNPQFQNVLKKAIEKKPFVSIGQNPGEYFVKGSTGNQYPVKFQRSASGKPLGSCLCMGAMQGFYCYHLCAALLAHMAFILYSLRAPAPKRQFKFI